MIFRFSKVPKPKKFDYKPRFYDPEKEERENRISNSEKRRIGGSEGAKASIKGSFRKSFYAESVTRREQMRRSNYRLFMIIAVLLLLTYFLLKSNLPGLLKLLDPGASGS